MSLSTDLRENREFASEIKFLVSPALADQIRDWARGRLRHLALAIGFGCAFSLLAQTPENPPEHKGGPPAEAGQPERDPGFDGPPPFSPGGPGGGVFGGPGGMQDETKLVKQFDKDGDQRLNAAERKAAFEFLQKERAEGRGRRGPGGPGGGRGGFGGRGENQEPPQPGPKLAPADVKSFPDA